MILLTCRALITSPSPHKHQNLTFFDLLLALLTPTYIFENTLINFLSIIFNIFHSVHLSDAMMQALLASIVTNDTISHGDKKNTFCKR